MHARPYSVIYRTNCAPSERKPLVYTHPRYYTGWLVEFYGKPETGVLAVQYLQYRSITPLKMGTVRDFWVLKEQGTHDLAGFGQRPSLLRIV